MKSHEQVVIETLQEDVAKTQHSLHLTHQELNIARGELAGYKLGLKLLPYFSRKSVEFLAHCAKVKARFF